MTQEQSPDNRLRQSAEDLRKETGTTDEKTKILLEEWAKRIQDGRPLTEYEVETHLRVLEENMKNITYGPALERTVYHAVMERMRLKMQLKQNPDPKDLEMLKDLDRRITNVEYLQSSIDDITDTLARYERYRQHFGLDAANSGVPRDAAMEGKVLSQMNDLQRLLPVRTTLWKIRHFEQKGDTAAAQQFIAQLPDAQKWNTPEKRDNLARTIELDIRKVVNVHHTRKDGVEIAQVDAMYLKMVEEHFQIVLQREKDLGGKGDPKSEAEKKEIRKQRGEILGEFLGYNYVSLERRAQLTSLLTRSGHIGQPYENTQVEGKPKKEYGKFKGSEALGEERDKSIASLRKYTSEFRANVLNREDKTFKIPGINFEIPFDPAAHIEHLMTTGVVPLKVRMAVPFAEGAAAPWAIFDAQLQLLNKNWGGIRDARTRAILRPLYEKLGLPENYSDLPPEDQKKVMAEVLKDEKGKMRSTLQILDQFKKEQSHLLDNIDRDLDTIQGLLKIKKPEELVLAGEPKQPKLPLDLNALKNASDEELAGAYIYIMRELTVTHPQELSKAQLAFMGNLNTNLDLQIDIGDVEKQLARAWITEWPLAILALLGEGAGLYLLVRRGIPWAIKKTPAAIRGTYNVGKWTVEKSIQGGSRLTQALRGTPKGAPASAAPSPGVPSPGGTASAMEKGVETASKMKTAGRVLGHLGFLVTEAVVIYEIAEKVKQIRKSTHLGDRELAHTALEFWKGNKIPGLPNMYLSNVREGPQAEQWYKEEIAVLEKSAFVEDMRFVVGQMTLPDPPVLPGQGDLAPLQKELPALASRRQELLDRQQALLQSLSEEKRWLHIELPYIEQIFTRTNDESRPGYNVNISGGGLSKFYGGPIDDALRAGPGNRQRHRDLVNSRWAPQQYADQFKSPTMDVQYWKEQAAKLKERKSTEQYKQEFAALAKDMELYVEDVAAAEEKVKDVPGVVLNGDKRTVVTSEVLGGTIENPIDVSEASHPTEIRSGGKQIYLRLPEAGWTWQVVQRQNGRAVLDPKNRLVINNTAEHFGKLGFSGTGQLAFYRKGAPAPSFYVEVK